MYPGYTSVFGRMGGMLHGVYLRLWENGRHAAQSCPSSLGWEGGMLRRVLLLLWWEGSMLRRVLLLLPGVRGGMLRRVLLPSFTRFTVGWETMGRIVLPVLPWWRSLLRIVLPASHERRSLLRIVLPGYGGRWCISPVIGLPVTRCHTIRAYPTLPPWVHLRMLAHHAGQRCSCARRCVQVHQAQNGKYPWVGGLCAPQGPPSCYRWWEINGRNIPDVRGELSDDRVATG